MRDSVTGHWDELSLQPFSLLQGVCASQRPKGLDLLPFDFYHVIGNYLSVTSLAQTLVLPKGPLPMNNKDTPSLRKFQRF